MKRIFLPCIAVFSAVAAVSAKPEKVLVTVSSNSQAPGYEAWKALDGNERTMWHSNWHDATQIPSQP